MLHVDVRVLRAQGVTSSNSNFIQSLLFTYCSIFAVAVLSCALQGLPSSIDEKELCCGSGVLILLFGQRGAFTDVPSQFMSSCSSTHAKLPFLEKVPQSTPDTATEPHSHPNSQPEFDIPPTPATSTAQEKRHRNIITHKRTRPRPRHSDRATLRIALLHRRRGSHISSCHLLLSPCLSASLS